MKDLMKKSSTFSSKGIRQMVVCRILFLCTEYN